MTVHERPENVDMSLRDTGAGGVGQVFEGKTDTASEWAGKDKVCREEGRRTGTGPNKTKPDTKDRRTVEDRGRGERNDRGAIESDPPVVSRDLSRNVRVLWTTVCSVTDLCREPSPGRARWKS